VIDIVRFDHISMAVAELDPQIDLLQRLFGFRYAGRFEEESFFGANLEVPGSSNLGWEVLAPNGEQSYLRRFLEGPHGPGLHHVALRVPDIQAAAAELRAEGIAPWGVREPEDDAAEGADQPPPLAPAPSAGFDAAGEAEDATRGVAYIHPRQGGYGFLYQLYAGEPWHEATAFHDDGEHTLGIKAVNHLAHAHADRDELAAWYTRVFGMQLAYRSPEETAEATGFRTAVLDVPGRQLRFEVIAPAGSDSFIQRFLERRGPAMHHVTFEVEDWERARAACAHHDVQIFGERAGETDGVPWREAFIHPRSTGGMLTQFFWQAEPGVWI
jgi:methylmalonyl-CoA epimerase